MEMLQPIVDTFSYILAIFAAGFIFMFCISLLTVASYLAILIGKDLYQIYFKEEVEKIRRKYESIHRN